MQPGSHLEQSLNSPQPNQGQNNTQTTGNPPQQLIPQQAQMGQMMASSQQPNVSQQQQGNFYQVSRQSSTSLFLINFF